MPRLTITIDEDQEEYLDEISGDDGEYASKSEAVRHFIQTGEDQAERIAELEQKVERLENEKRQIIEQHQEHEDLVRYVDDELSYREAGLATRLRWWIYGKPKQ